MSLAVRKLGIVVFAITIILLANAWAIASWLDNIGLIAWASNIRAEFLTGTAIVVILALLVLLSSSSRRDILSLAGAAEFAIISCSGGGDTARCVGVGYDAGIKGVYGCSQVFQHLLPRLHSSELGYFRQAA